MKQATRVGVTLLLAALLFNGAAATLVVGMTGWVTDPKGSTVPLPKKLKLGMVLTIAEILRDNRVRVTYSGGKSCKLLKEQLEKCCKLAPPLPAAALTTRASSKAAPTRTLSKSGTPPPPPRAAIREAARANAPARTQPPRAAAQPTVRRSAAGSQSITAGLIEKDSLQAKTEIIQAALIKRDSRTCSRQRSGISAAAPATIVQPPRRQPSSDDLKRAELARAAAQLARQKSDSGNSTPGAAPPAAPKTKYNKSGVPVGGAYIQTVTDIDNKVIEKTNTRRFIWEAGIRTLKYRSKGCGLGGNMKGGIVLDEVKKDGLKFFSDNEITITKTDGTKYTITGAKVMAVADFLRGEGKLRPHQVDEKSFLVVTVADRRRRLLARLQGSRARRRKLLARIHGSRASKRRLLERLQGF